MPTDADKLTSSLRPIDRNEFGYDHARRLLWRAGFGGDPHQIRTLADWGPDRAVDHLIEVDEINAGAHPRSDRFEADIMRPPTEAEQRAYRDARRNQDEDAVARFRRMRQMRQRQDRAQIREIQKWWLTRMIETPRPLEEKMALFWHGHLATSYRTIENSYHMFMQNQMYRRFALGNYGDLLHALIRDPAMLKYLDNDENRRHAPNENLAREIMELFSLGEGAYSEHDIKEGARALTGFTFDHNEFVFREDQHDPGTKSILGRRGAFDGDDFVDIILARRSCAEFICFKLYRYFVGDIPESGRDPRRRAAVAVVRQMADTFRGANYELAPVLRKLFLSRHFYEASALDGQIKSPVMLLVGAVRSLKTPVRDLDKLVDALELMGQDLFFPPNVKGWEGGRSWINTSTLYVRQNSLNFLITGKTPTGFDALREIESYDPSDLLDDLARSDPGAERDPRRAIDYLLRFTMGRDPAPRHKKALVEFIDGHGGRVTPQLLTGALVLISAMPEYQLC